MQKKTAKTPARPRAVRSADAPPKENPVQKSQAERLMEIARKAKQGGSAQAFARSMGKDTLARNARKIGKGEVGGSNV